MEDIPQYLSSKQIKILERPVADNLVFYDQGRNKYVNLMVIVDTLNEAFNNAWNWEILDTGIEKAQEYNGKNAGGGCYIWVKGRLHYPIWDPDANKIAWCFKDAIGGKPLVGNVKVQSQAYKSASSDALKKAASMLGIAPNVYMRDDIYAALSESDQDAWTDEAKIDFRNEIEEMSKLAAAMTPETFSALINNFCNDTGNYYTYGNIGPSNVKAFLDYVHKVQQEEPNQKAEEETKTKFTFGNNK